MDNAETLNEIAIIEPTTGELIDPRDMPKIAEAISRIRMVKQQLNDAITELTRAVADESKRVGTRTIYAGPSTIELTADHETQWDPEELLKLLDVGLPADRYEALVTQVVTTKVDAKVARQLAAANDAYKAIIERAQTQAPKTPYVRIKRS